MGNLITIYQLSTLYTVHRT